MSMLEELWNGNVEFGNRPVREGSPKYDAFSLRHGFLLRTDVYRVSRMENGVCIYSEYSLNDGSGQPEIKGIQEMKITILEDADHEEIV